MQLRMPSTCLKNSLELPKLSGAATFHFALFECPQSIFFFSCFVRKANVDGDRFLRFPGNADIDRTTFFRQFSVIPLVAPHLLFASACQSRSCFELVRRRKRSLLFAGPGHRRTVASVRPNNPFAIERPKDLSRPNAN